MQFKISESANRVKRIIERFQVVMSNSRLCKEETEHPVDSGHHNRSSISMFGSSSLPIIQRLVHIKTRPPKSVRFNLMADKNVSSRSKSTSRVHLAPIY